MPKTQLRRANDHLANAYQAAVAAGREGLARSIDRLWIVVATQAAAEERMVTASRIEHRQIRQAA